MARQAAPQSISSACSTSAKRLITFSPNSGLLCRSSISGSPRRLAPLFEPLLPLQFAVAITNPLVQYFAQFRIAFENEMNIALGNHQQARIGARHHRGHLLLAHQTRLLAKNLDFAEGGQRVVVA